MKALTIAIIALLTPSEARYLSMAQEVDADSFDKDTEPSKALLPGDAAEPIEKVEASPEMEVSKSETKRSQVDKNTGLLHFPDGHREFWDGGEVEGVNNWS